MSQPWSKEWPTEPGLYWFYGKTGLLPIGGPKVGVVRAHAAGGRIVVEGMFQVVTKGFFQKLETPTLPEWSNHDHR